MAILPLEEIKGELNFHIWREKAIQNEKELAGDAFQADEIFQNFTHLLQEGLKSESSISSSSEALATVERQMPSANTQHDPFCIKQLASLNVACSMKLIITHEIIKRLTEDAQQSSNVLRNFSEKIKSDYDTAQELLKSFSVEDLNRALDPDQRVKFNALKRAMINDVCKIKSFHLKKTEKKVYALFRKVLQKIEQPQALADRYQAQFRALMPTD